MQASVFIWPHERGEALSAYADCLTPEQIEEIEEAPETALVNLRIDLSSRTCRVLVIPEGSMPVTDEEIAKIIDPEAFGLPNPYVGDNWLSDRDEARAKAAAIRKMFGDEQRSDTK